MNLMQRLHNLGGWLICEFLSAGRIYVFDRLPTKLFGWAGRRVIARCMEWRKRTETGDTDLQIVKKTLRNHSEAIATTRGGSSSRTMDTINDAYEWIQPALGWTAANAFINATSSDNGKPSGSDPNAEISAACKWLDEFAAMLTRTKLNRGRLLT